MSRPLSNEQQTSLLRAAEHGDLTTVRRICELSKDINVNQIKKKDGSTPLHLACYEGHVSIVEYLVEKQKASPQTRDNDKDTPLHNACWNGHLEIVRYIMTKRSGTNINARNKNGNTPLHVACMGGELNIVRYLAGIPGINIKSKDINKATPLQVAKQCDETEIADFLECIMNEAKDDDGQNQDDWDVSGNQPSMPPDPINPPAGKRKRTAVAVAVAAKSSPKNNSIEVTDTTKTKKPSFSRTLIFHCTRGSHRMDVLLPISDAVTLQDLYDELGKEGNKRRMRRFPDDYEDIKANRKRIELELRTESAGEAFLICDLKYLRLMSTQQMWENHDKVKIWVNVAVANVSEYGLDDDDEDDSRCL